MTDAQSHHLERLIRERTDDLPAGSARAREVHESLLAELTVIRRYIPRQEAHRLEVLIDRLAGKS